MLDQKQRTKRSVRERCWKQWLLGCRQLFEEAAEDRAASREGRAGGCPKVSGVITEGQARWLSWLPASTRNGDLITPTASRPTLGPHNLFHEEMRGSPDMAIRARGLGRRVISNG